MYSRIQSCLPDGTWSSCDVSVVDTTLLYGVPVDAVTVPTAEQVYMDIEILILLYGLSFFMLL